MPAGSKPGERRGGRQKGSPNKRTVRQARAVKRVIEKVAAATGTPMFDGDAHALLILTYKDETQPLAVRLDAAKAAIGYETPKLTSVDQTMKGTLGYINVPTAERDPFDPMDAAAGSPVPGDPKASRH